MGGVIKYSGLVTKVHAMSGRLLTLPQYEELISQNGFRGGIDYLRANTDYRSSFSDMPDTDIHREAVERRLTESLYYDYMKLYRFAGRDIRRYLEPYFIHFEVLLMKQCLRNVRNLASPDVRLGVFEDFFRRHSKLSLDGMNHSDTIAEFMPSIKGSRYERILYPIFDSGSDNLHDYELALDLYYFSQVWKLLNPSKTESDELSAALGTKIDLLNLQWIYRSKKYFHMDPDLIMPMLIPIRYKLRQNDIESCVYAEGMDEFNEHFNRTRYASCYPGEDPADLFLVSDELLAHIYRVQTRNNPYSAAPLQQYLYFKEEEITHLVNILEGLRYSRPAATLERFIPATVRKTGNTPGGDS